MSKHATQTAPPGEGGTTTSTKKAAPSLETSLDPRSLDPAQLRPLSPIIDEPECLRRVPVSRRTWFEWREKKGLPYIRVGKRVLYDWGNVHSWLLRQQRGE